MFTYSPTRAYSLTMFTYVPTRAYSRSHLLTNLAIALQPIGRRQRGLLTTYYLLLTTYYLLLTTYYLLLAADRKAPAGPTYYLLLTTYYLLLTTYYLLLTTYYLLLTTYYLLLAADRKAPGADTLPAAHPQRRGRPATVCGGGCNCMCWRL
jgi:hypothetical protein